MPIKEVILKPIGKSGQEYLEEFIEELEIAKAQAGIPIRWKVTKRK